MAKKRNVQFRVIFEDGSAVLYQISDKKFGVATQFVNSDFFESEDARKSLLEYKRNCQEKGFQIEDL